MRGAANCICSTSGRCDDDLLCVAGRCLASGGPDETPDPPLVRPLPPRPSRPDAAAAPIPDASSEPPDASSLPLADAEPPADAAPDAPPPPPPPVDSGDPLDASSD